MLLTSLLFELPGKTLLAAEDIARDELLAVYTGKILTRPPERDQFVYGIVHNRQHIWYVNTLLLPHLHT